MSTSARGRPLGALHRPADASAPVVAVRVVSRGETDESTLPDRGFDDGNDRLPGSPDR